MATGWHGAARSRPTAAPRRQGNEDASTPPWPTAPPTAAPPHALLLLAMAGGVSLLALLLAITDGAGLLSVLLAFLAMTGGVGLLAHLLVIAGGMGLLLVRVKGMAAAATAMVLLPTGELREYPRPATAGRAVEDAVEAGEAGRWFLCDADKMGFEGPVAAVGGGEELRPGQIYFVLPVEARRNGLRREDVAALAVRASAALVNKAAAAGNANSGGGGGGRRRRAGSVAPLVFAPPQEEDNETVSYKSAPAKRRPVVSRAKSAGRMQPRFAPDLSAIPECDTSE